MAWRVISVSKPSRLSVKQYQLLIEQEQTSASIPLEDIAAVILETHQAELTANLLAELASRGAALFACDDKHTPSGVFLPFLQHSRFSETAWLQQECSAPFKKRCWQKLVQAKILNQASVLKKLERENSETLLAWAKRVQSGDPSNTEAQAARIYWQTLFTDFTREKEDKRNSALNYCYAILRGGIARAVSCAGLLPCFGLHHANKLNAFNLADDLLEPFRPFADFHVARLISSGDLAENKDLSPQEKAFILRVLSGNCDINGEHVSMLPALEQTANSLALAMKSKDPALLVLPGIPLDCATHGN